MFRTFRARLDALPTAAKAGVAAGSAIVALILVCTLCVSCQTAGRGATTTPTQQAAGPTATNAPPKATPAPKIVLKASGKGAKKTETFSVDGQWKLSYNCQNTTAISTFPLFITVYTADGDYADSVSYDCAKKYGGDSSIQHDGGKFYLDINTGVPWDVTVEDIPN